MLLRIEPPHLERNCLVLIMRHNPVCRQKVNRELLPVLGASSWQSEGIALGSFTFIRLDGTSQEIRNRHTIQQQGLKVLQRQQRLTSDDQMLPGVPHLKVAHHRGKGLSHLVAQFFEDRW